MENETNVNTISRSKLLVKALVRFALSLVFLGAMFFVPAGNMKYWNAWLYIAAMFIPMTVMMVYLMIRDPEFVEKRISMKEKEKSQKKYVRISMPFFIAAFIVPGFDYRFGWSSVPVWLVIAATAVMILGYRLFAAVMMANRYASRVIEIQEGQKVIDSGPYSLVRHPMYLAILTMYGVSQLILGSWYALIPMAALPVIFVYRIVNEEKVLENGLAGYREYMTKVKYRLIPFVW